MKDVVIFRNGSVEIRMPISRFPPFQSGDSFTLWMFDGIGKASVDNRHFDEPTDTCYINCRSGDYLTTHLIALARKVPNQPDRYEIDHQSWGPEQPGDVEEEAS